MPVTTRHREYNNWAADWLKCRDVIGGQRSVLARATGEANGYLPRLAKQTPAEYEAYKRRATFYGAAGRTVEALTGAIFRRDPILNVSDQLREQCQDIDYAGMDLPIFAKVATSEVLSVGRYGVLLDAPGEDVAAIERRPYWVGYCAEDIRNWRIAIVSGMTVLMQVILCERFDEPEDEFSVSEKTRYLVLDLDEDGWYRQRRFQEAGSSDQSVMMEEVYPLRAGERLDFIPFVFVNSLSLHVAVERPPLLDLVDVNLAHWRKSVDYAHGLHFTALPTPWVADRDAPTQRELRIGSMEAWVLSADGRCGMLEFAGTGMNAVKEAIMDDEQRMARLGAELLTPEKREVETAESKRITSASRTASLSSLAGTVSRALTQVLRWHAWWIGESDHVNDSEIGIDLNRDFVDVSMEPGVLTALVQARQAGEISRRTFIENLIKGEIIDGRSVEEELVEIEAEQDVQMERDGLREATDRTQQLGKLMLAQMEGESGAATPKASVE